MNKKTVRDIELKYKRVLVRADFNVPLDAESRITDDARIVKTLPTLQYILSQNAKFKIGFGRSHPIVGNTRLFHGGRAVIGQMFGAGDIILMRAVIIAAGQRLLIQFFEHS